MWPLADLEVLVLDCQASGATPERGELLELGWGATKASRETAAPHAAWILPLAGGRVSRIVRQLTGWSEACLPRSIDGADAWRQICSTLPPQAERLPVVIHFARFELPFLRALHLRAGGTENDFPLDVVCIHAIAERLFPDLPRRNLRALAGHLGHSVDLIRRAEGHVAATAATWRALVPRLAERGISTWDELVVWLATPTVRSVRKKRVFPMPPAVRRALPEGPGVYRFLRPNGDVLYVGKATSLRARVASHFSAGTRTTERALEMLSQAHALDATPTASVLEAALLETDEIKRLDPPYNVQLRGGERTAWFASVDWSECVSVPDPAHPVGPLPSRLALHGLWALRQLLEGAEPSIDLRAAAVECSQREAPSLESFLPVWARLVATCLPSTGSTWSRLLRAGSALTPPDSPADARPGWDPARILRHLERALSGGANLVRRARQLSLLAWADIDYVEPKGTTTRRLRVRAGRIESAADSAADAPLPASEPVPERQDRRAAFDAERYDRMRILATELRRIVGQGGTVRIRVGSRTMAALGEAHDSRDSTRATSAKVSGESSSPR